MTTILRRRGSSARVRAQWRATYATTPYQHLPWFDPDPSPQVTGAVTEGFLRRGTAVLDLGCGAGSNVLYLARMGFEAHGVDLAPEAIRSAEERARTEGLSVDVRVGDALALPFPAGRFDAAIDNGCFHTLPVRRRKDYAREVARVVRPGGQFVLSWIGREQTSAHGPPHRPSLAEVTGALEERFVFVRAEFHEGGKVRGASVYDARLLRRSSPQPPPR
jgi:cyclopropane fatty-acyl-phospholipid synthase-like methyltransferase